METGRTIAAVMALLALSCQPAPAEIIRLEGGAAAISTVFSPIKDAFEKTTGDTLAINLTNPTKSLISLERGEVDMVSINALAIDGAIAKAREQGVVIDPATLHRTVVAPSSLVIFLHRGNPVSRLSKEQLKGIFTGKISNWREVGGDDREIAVFWGRETPYLNALFGRTILDGEPVTPKARPAGDHFNLREIVISTPGAIVINTNGLAMPKLKVPETPSMTLPILAITKGKPTSKVRKVLDFYQEEFGFMDGE